MFGWIDKMNRGFILHIEKIPPILTIGAYAAPSEKAVERYQLDYGFLGIPISCTNIAKDRLRV